jgi:hypothetical protein
LNSLLCKESKTLQARNDSESRAGYGRSSATRCRGNDGKSKSDEVIDNTVPKQSGVISLIITKIRPIKNGWLKSRQTSLWLKKQMSLVEELVTCEPTSKWIHSVACLGIYLAR